MKELIIALAGLGIGAGVAFVVTKRHYETLMDMEKKSGRYPWGEDKEEKEAKSYSDILKLARKEANIEECSEEELFWYYAEMLKELRKAVDPNDFGWWCIDRLTEMGYTPMIDGEPAEYYGDEDLDDREVVNPTDDSSDVYEIDETVHNTTHTEYSKEVIYYYFDDQTFVDGETNEPVENWRQYFGDDILNILEDHNWRQSHVYIRNEALESDYQIVLREGSFAAANGESDDEEDYKPGDMAD